MPWRAKVKTFSNVLILGPFAGSKKDVAEKIRIALMVRGEHMDGEPILLEVGETKTVTGQAFGLPTEA